MKEMTSHERMARTFRHEETDRVPIVDSPWGGTIRRWQAEGMPKKADWRDFFGTDKTQGIGVDCSPRYESKVLEKTKEYTIKKTSWGVTLKNFNEQDSTPEFLDFTITTPEEWEKAKRRMQPTRDRINWHSLKKDFKAWRADDRWINGNFWFGFDNTHTGMVGTQTLLIAMAENPEWVKDIFSTCLDMSIALCDMMWDEGYRFDCLFWYDDMGYKGTPFFSPQMYRDLLQPYHKKAVEWAHSKGIPAHLHSCGNIMRLIPDVIVTGIDGLNPIEIKAGMDVLGLKRDYGKKLVLHGGINAVLWDRHDEILEEIHKTLPAVAEGGGYIFASDHSIPNTVSLNNFRDIIGTVKKLTSR